VRTSEAEEIAAGSQPRAPARAVVGTATEAVDDPAAGGSEYSAEYTRCLERGEAAAGVTPAMAECIGAELDRQDARLNAAYQAAMRVRAETERAALRDAQRAWIARRDAECRGRLTGGSIDRLELPGCHLSMTAIRTAELEQMR
jgi:uncharacterized protein YecT (DUF1311 family)